MKKLKITVPKIQKLKGGHRRQVVETLTSSMNAAGHDDVVLEGRLISTEHSGMRRPMPPFNPRKLVL